METNYTSISISEAQAKTIAKEMYGLEGKISSLAGELDFNFKIKTKKESFILKISRPNVQLDYINFQHEILAHVQNADKNICSPKTLPDIKGNPINKHIDASGNVRYVRLLTWVDGRLWSSVNPKNEKLFLSLGEKAGKISALLSNFDHPLAHRDFEWDIAQAAWTKAYIPLFEHEQQLIITHFIKRFDEVQNDYIGLRKTVIHNDANDNNVIVSNQLIDPEVKAIIDFGDAVYTQSINDLAVAIAYAIMAKPDALRAALPLIQGYHQEFPLLDEELRLLYVLVAMRLVISVTKSAINKQKEPDNAYLLISEKPAWTVLEKWININENIAYYSFRAACGYPAHPNEKAFNKDLKNIAYSLYDMFPSAKKKNAFKVDMSVSSTWLGHESDFNDNDLMTYKVKGLEKENPQAIIAGGYNEIRPFYITDAYKKEGNSGSEYRSVHLGVDFWMDAEAPIHALFDGKIVVHHLNDHHKDYGPTLILEHKTESGIPFYSLYGHLTMTSLKLHKKGDRVKKGELIAYVGNPNENGSWAPHLHFQLMLDLLGNTTDFPGVAFPKEAQVWKSICPDPNQLFKLPSLEEKAKSLDEKTFDYRKEHLGKSLSLSYIKPLKMVRGTGAFLMDNTGRKYLDTVNNVAHVGHENVRIVKAGQNQMAVLNTNTRYLHENINAFAEELLSTFPEELSVVHFVNSGSEANELAMRMAYAYTGEKDIIALEVGYHGNTNSCINVSSYKFDGKGGQGAPEHTHIVPLPDAYRGMYRGKHTTMKYASFISEKIEYIRSKRRKLAGFICESIISCGGQIELPKDYLAIAYDLVHKAGGLCIADEVQTGCGRVGSKFWGFQLHDVIPDIVTIGKPIGNGHPLAAVVCTKKVAEAFANGMEYFNTFGGNPVSCAIGTEVLRVIKDERLQENALLVGDYLKAELRRLHMRFPIIGDVRGQGLFLGFELVDQDMNPLADQATYLANRMKDLGVLMSTDGKDNNVLKIKPPMVFSINDAKELIYRLKSVLAEDFMSKKTDAF